MGVGQVGVERAAVTTRERRWWGRWAFPRLLAATRSFDWVDTMVDGRTMSARRSKVSPVATSPEVVLLAGLGLSGRYLLPVGAELAPRLPVWVPDLPGYGRSEAPPEPLDLPGLADAVVSWMDRVGLRRAALVGNSMGCQIAVEVAARHPERVSHLLLEGPTMDAGARSVPRHLVRVAAAAFREPPSLGPVQVFDWFGTGWRTLLPTIRHAFAHRIEDRLRHVRCPALVVRGGRDPIVTQRWARYVAAGIPQGSLQVVPGCGHVMTYSDPDVFADIVEDLVTRPARSLDDADDDRSTDDGRNTTGTAPVLREGTA